MVNKHSAEVLSEGCLLSKCKPGRGLHRLLANNLKKNGQNISKFISFKDEPEACGNQLLFFAGICPLSSFCPVDLLAQLWYLHCCELVTTEIKGTY